MSDPLTLVHDIKQRNPAQQAAIAAMTAMLDATPFIERYALYNWVEDVRAVVTNNVLTPAGITSCTRSRPTNPRAAATFRNNEASSRSTVDNTPRRAP